MDSSTTERESAEDDPEGSSIQKIKQLLAEKDDTSRFVGLALLKSVLDNSERVRTDEQSVSELWQDVPPKFIDRLLKTGSGPRAARRDGKEMLDIAVAVLHTFTLLLPEAEKRQPKLVGRIPLLIASVLQSSEETTKLSLQILLTLVSFPEGAGAFAQVKDVTPLIEIAPSHPLVLDVFFRAWVRAPASAQNKAAGLAAQIRQTLPALLAAFKDTDAVTLLAFLDRILRSLDTAYLPSDPSWVGPAVRFIQNLTSSKPTAAGRAAYTNLAATLVQTFPTLAPRLLFGADVVAEKPFSYLFMNLLLIDLRSSFPALLEQLNSPSYPDTSRRLASAFDVLSSFVGYLVHSLGSDDDEHNDDDDDKDNDSPPPLCMPPDLLLKLRRAIAETLSAAMEHLRDRWDASVAGAPGLHPSARTGRTNEVTTATPRLPLTWDAKSTADGSTAAGAGMGADPFVLAAVRALAVWLREDDNPTLRGEAAGLCDMLLDLYRGSSSSPSSTSTTPSTHLDFRRPVLVALEGITASPRGIEAFLAHDGWQILTGDMLAILRESSRVIDDDAAARGIDILRVVLPVAEAEGESDGPREAWMDVVTAVAGWDVPQAPGERPGGGGVGVGVVQHEFQCAVLQLVAALCVAAHPGMRRRYVHSIGAVVGIAEQLRRREGQDAAGKEALEEVIETLSALR